MRMTWSASRKNTAATATITNTMAVVTAVSGLRPRPVALSQTLMTAPDYAWQEWRDSNPQPPVLETGALAIELHSSGSACGGPEVRRGL